ncbi:alpha-1-antitrypsin-like protein GS55-MS isoform X1 [Leuresthes tenuis]|uniref:alpha-1-antitrypsin-like protein GS55-MS isoform X1 n=1 Tax=Leuresthes tenuis TaxID=355514 RepID=UPI003B502036
MVREEAMMSVVYSLGCLTVLALLTCSSAHMPAIPKSEKLSSRHEQRERETSHLNQLNTSALNAALAFEPYRDLATKSTAMPGVQQQRPNNILFSPLGLVSALALLCRVSGSESRSQALEALGMAANSTQESVEATISTLTDLQHSLTLQEGGGGGGVQKGTFEPGAGENAGIGGATAGVGIRETDARNRTVIDDVAEGRTGTEDGDHAGAQLKVWSSLHVDGKPQVDYETFLSRPLNTGRHALNINFDTLMKDLQDSDKLILNNFVYFKGLQPFERRHTGLRSFKLNATTSVETAMMYRDDSSEVMMLYDTNCSATVVRMAFSERLASLLLLPKGELQPLEDCLSDSRMSFWVSNLKPGRAEIRFPKFQLRKSYSLESLLRNAGVSSIFSQRTNFAGIAKKKMLELIKAPHEVMLEVGESKLEDRGRPDIQLDFSVPQRITFDRPFMLIVYDDLTGIVLLIGRITDPTDA